VLRLRLIDEHLDGAIEIGADQHITTSLFVLLDQWIRLIVSQLQAENMLNRTDLEKYKEQDSTRLGPTFSLEISSGSGLMIASGCGANMAQVTVALCALMPSQKSLRSRRTCNDKKK